MKLILTRDDSPYVDFMFKVKKQSDLVPFFEAFESVKYAKVWKGVLTYTSIANTEHTYNVVKVKAFEHYKQATGCHYYDLSTPPQFGINEHAVTPHKYMGLGGNSVPLYRSDRKYPWATQWGLDLSLRLVEHCANLYVLEHLHREYPHQLPVEIRFKDEIRLLARQFSQYIDMIIGGELRHAYSEASMIDMKAVAQRSDAHRALVDTLFGIYGENIDPCEDCDQATEDCEPGCCEHYEDVMDENGSSENARLGDREIMWREWYDMRQQYGLPLLEAANDLFSECHWASSFGGHSWGRLCKSLIRWYAGGYAPPGAPAWKNDLMFVDTVWSLQHNGGYALNKVWAIPAVLQWVLNRKFDGKVHAIVKHASEGVQELWVKRIGGIVSRNTRITDLI